VVRAARTIRAWESAVAKGSGVGAVYVDVRDMGFGDRLSMLYHGLQIAVLTNRSLFVDRSKFGSVELPGGIKQLDGDAGGEKLNTGPGFTCSDFSDRHPKLLLKGASWPQVLYTHDGVAPWLRAHFGFHAGYFMGNYLFGDVKGPSGSCRAMAIDGIEGFEFPESGNFRKPEDYDQVIPRCGLEVNDSFLVVVGNRKVTKGYREVTYVNDKDDGEMVCAMRKLTGSRRIIHTFGSRFGFWATALQGGDGGFVNGLDHICVNTTNSQQGSIWHTWCPKDRSRYVFRSNSHLFPCGPQTSDTMRMFALYLFW
jgi:hypothetical protein